MDADSVWPSVEPFLPGKESLDLPGATQNDAIPLLDSNHPGDLAVMRGVCGLSNLGNTCFMNSGLQCLLSNASLVRFFLEEFTLDEFILESLTGRFAELLNKIWRGDCNCLDPSTFKEYLGIYHPQFKDYRQHDCQEFLALLLDSLHEQLNQAPAKQISAESENTEDVSESCSSCSLNLGQAAKQITANSENTEDMSDTCSVCSLNLGQVDKTVPAGDNQVKQLDSDTVSGDVGMGASEDSNQSTISSNSSTITEGAHFFRMIPIPHNIKDNSSTESSELTAPDAHTTCPNSSQVENNLEHLFREAANQTASSSVCKNGSNSNKISNSLRFPDIEDYYMKDSKTLNTNVLVTEMEDEMVTMDSDKFLKQDNTLRQPDPLENFPDEAATDVKHHSPKGIKDTNLLANVKEKFCDLDTKEPIVKCLFRDQGDNTMEETNCSINNIKRMKIDEEQKNIRLQARRKVNTARNLTCEDNINNSNIGMNNQLVEAAALGGIQTRQQHRTRAQDVRDAELAWKKYLFKNKSIVVDQFQGQFKSTVICANCQHVSVTYEPFMYLSVPLPRAMERQISVIFVPSDSKPIVCHLISLNKQDTVATLMRRLLDQIGEETCELILAEVINNHIARVLESHSMIRFVDDDNRTVYAFEMIPLPQFDVISPASEDGDNSNVNLPSNNEQPVVQSNAQVEPEDVFETISHFSADDVDANSARKLPSNDSLNKSDWKSAENAVLNNFQTLDGATADHEWSLPISMETSMIWNNTDDSETPAKDTDGTYIWKTSTAASSDSTSWETDNNKQTDISKWDATLPSLGDDVTTREEDTRNEKVVNVDLSSDGWQSCVICLEEKLDHELQVHKSCGGMLCHACLEMSYKHYGEAGFSCPVCSVPMNPADGFDAVSSSGEKKPLTRILSMAVAFRYDQMVDESLTKRMFGHPYLIYVHSRLSGEALYNMVDRVVPLTVSYTILLTDGQGYHCSRCVYTDHCSGCEVDREGEVSLHPGDHLTVRFEHLTEEQITSAGSYVDHQSMDNLRPKEPLTLFDCLSAFTDSEVLDEHNPWYCPQCCRNQCANKTMTVWRYPQTLIIQLKRFVFHDLSSSKLDNKVVFPTEDLDLSSYISGPNDADLRYDLQSCVCHFGGVNTGHYTSYAKHPVNRKWYHYNDEVTSCQAPHSDNYSSAYVLFYQKQGTQGELNLREKYGPGCVGVPDVCSPLAKTATDESEADAIDEILQSLNNVSRPQDE